MGLLRGHRTVAQAMDDPEMAGLARALMSLDVAPSLPPVPGLDVHVYVEAILGRFRNPAIEHTLAQIAWDGTQKLPIRLLGTIADALAAGRPVERLARPIAAWMAFVARQAHAGVAIVDPHAEALAVLGRAATGEAITDVERFLAFAPMFPPALAAEPRFTTALCEAYATEAAFALTGIVP
jgi:fructuronate reductase